MALHSSTLLFYVSLGQLWDVIITHIQITMKEIVQFWVTFLHWNFETQSSWFVVGVKMQRIWFHFARELTKTTCQEYALDGTFSRKKFSKKKLDGTFSRQKSLDGTFERKKSRWTNLTKRIVIKRFAVGGDCSPWHFMFFFIWVSLTKK